MKTKEINSQEEYNENKFFDGLLIIKCAYIELSENSRAELWGNSSAVLRGNSRAVLRGNSRAVLWENSSAVLRGNSSAELWENSRAVLRGNSRAVLSGNSSAELWENSRAVLWENSRAELWGNSSAVLRGNSRAELWGNSSAVLRGNSRAVLWENSRAELWGNSSAELWENSSADNFDHSHSIICNENKVRLFGNATKNEVRELKYNRSILSSCKEVDGMIILYKSVNPENNSDFYSGKIIYEIGKWIICPDFDKNRKRQCGGGLHLCMSPIRTQLYNTGKILKCLVDKKDIVVYPGDVSKFRCRKVKPVAVVDIHGNEI